ncbi:hypothetical protein PRIPAC_73845 [Pristionchus pacificus]|uniref:Uncharacterized protein n=1 Tax=Pristionchus pacificus TaxID=54126 RepID=A0A2A6CQS2_PRIPA|nr:hypothetical protein PRIPAC_73845 [Pristionchus pacificus]|eukprot:PDM80562.1 hypothetical protein PRIPAC_35565 [Pristionchus pacificus]
MFSQYVGSCVFPRPNVSGFHVPGEEKRGKIYDRKNLKWRDLDWDEQKLCITLKKDIFRKWMTGALNLVLPHAYYEIIVVIDKMG